MQIIIDLHPGKPGEEQNIQTLLEELSKAGYSIQEGQTFEAYQTQAKLLVVDTKTKRFYFLNSYFPTVYGFMGKHERPLPIEKIDALLLVLSTKDSNLLERLYKGNSMTFDSGTKEKTTEYVGTAELSH